MDMETGNEAQQKKFLGIMRSLPQYEPHEALLLALESNFTNESLSAKDAIFSAYLKKQQLNYDNACSVLSTLLNIEDLSTMQIYVEFIQAEVTLKRINRLSYCFNMPKTNLNPEEVLAPYQDDVVLIPKASLLVSPLSKQLILALLPHRHEQLQLKDPIRRHVASVEKVTRSNIQIKFKRSCFPGEEILSQRFLIILRSRRTSFRYMYRAMQLLAESPRLRRYLFPIKTAFAVIPRVISLPIVALINKAIGSNFEQLQAVTQIIQGTNSQAPYIVFGPPGTGKTTTIVEAILQLRLMQPRSRILVTASSNSACDTIALRICEYMLLQTQFAERIKESQLTTLGVMPEHQLIRLYSRSIYFKGLNTVNPLLINHSNCANLQYKYLCVDVLRQFGIIVATLCTVGRLVTDNLGKCNFFTHIFIDEAGASSEPESLIGIMGIKQQDDCHVILSGDHKQLGAVIKSNRASKLGLGHSLMERLLLSEPYALDENGNYDRTLQTRLRCNYRSHPEIVRIYNSLFYDGELIALAPPEQVNLAAKWPMLPNGRFPIIFQATHGVTEREFDSKSSFNALEVRVLCWYVKQLLCNGLGGSIKVQEEDIGIVAPYMAQCKLVKEVLHQLGYFNVEVGSVENYQGREKNIIIASLVRSFAGMGFMKSSRRINVLLSRAKSLMILIGNPVTLRHHRDIDFIIKECKIHGNYLFKRKNCTVIQPHFLSEIEDNEPEGNEEDLFLYNLLPWCVQLLTKMNLAQSMQHNFGGKRF